MTSNLKAAVATVREAGADDAAAIAAIYNPFVLESAISFEEQAVSAQAMAQRIAQVQAAGLPWLVAQRDAGAFTLERLADLSASVQSREVPVHHYRFVSKNVYDVYSDGSRLLAVIASDKTIIIRDGWEAWAKALPVPAPLPAPPAAAP